MLNKSLYYSHCMISIYTRKAFKNKMLKLNWFYIFILQLKVQRNRRDRVEILTFLNTGKQVSGSTLTHLNTNTFFWKVITLPVKSYWMQHISSFLSSDLSVSRTSSRLLLIILLSLRIH